MSTDPIPTEWGSQVAVEHVGGVPFRMFTPRVTQLHHLLEYAARWDDAPYLIQGDRTLSFAEARRLVRRKAGELSELGLRPG